MEYLFKIIHTRSFLDLAKPKEQVVDYIVAEDYESMGRALDNLELDVIEITLVGKGILQGEVR